MFHKAMEVASGRENTKESLGEKVGMTGMRIAFASQLHAARLTHYRTLFLLCRLMLKRIKGELMSICENKLQGQIRRRKMGLIGLLSANWHGSVGVILKCV